MVLLALFRCKVCYYNYIGFGFPYSLGPNTPIDLGFIIILLDESTTVTTMERDWDFGNVVCLYCHLFFFVFETVREECVYLAGVSVSHVGYLKS